MAHESGNTVGSHATLTAEPDWSHVSGQESPSVLFMVGRFPVVTFAVKLILHIFSSPL